MEIWKPVLEWGDLYMVSSIGNILSLRSNRQLKKTKTYNGYIITTLSRKPINSPFFVHRLMAQAFLPNPNNLPDVNHKNGIKSDNRIDNLEWVTRSKNVIHAIKLGLYKPCGSSNFRNKAKPVAQYTNGGQKINHFKSAREAERITGFFQTGISSCARGNIPYFKEYAWKYEPLIEMRG